MDSNDYKEMAWIANEMINSIRPKYAHQMNAHKLKDYFEDMYYKQLQYEKDMEALAEEEEREMAF